MDERDFFVVVPFYNERSGILATLEALAAQSDIRFSLVLVDNGSTDQGGDIAQEFATRHPQIATHVVCEAQKGTGAASDTGFRYAIDHGALWIARTDADCIPRQDWVCNIKRAFREDGLELVAGKIRPRADDTALTWRDRMVLPLAVALAENFGKFHRRGPQFYYPYILVAGNNMAITSDLYKRAGGFPRSRIEDEHEDRVLSERVRTITPHGGVRKDIVVYNSIRRARRYGYINTLLWYWDYKYKPPEVDVRWSEDEQRGARAMGVASAPSLRRLHPARLIRSLGRPSQARARFHETRIYLASHPFALLFAEGVRPLGRRVRLPGLGSVVNDPDLAFELLCDSRFTKSGPGSAGAAITQVMGNVALLNMDGPEHRALRDRLGDLFAPAYLDTQIAPLLRDEVQKLSSALTRTG